MSVVVISPVRQTNLEPASMVPCDVSVPGSRAVVRPGGNQWNILQECPGGGGDEGGGKKDGRGRQNNGRRSGARVVDS